MASSLPLLYFTAEAESCWVLETEQTSCSVLNIFKARALKLYTFQGFDHYNADVWLSRIDC